MMSKFKIHEEALMKDSTTQSITATMARISMLNDLKDAYLNT